MEKDHNLHRSEFCDGAHHYDKSTGRKVAICGCKEGKIRYPKEEL